jgi:hypothetical protein
MIPLIGDLRFLGHALRAAKVPGNVTNRSTDVITWQQIVRKVQVTASHTRDTP